MAEVANRTPIAAIRGERMALESAVRRTEDKLQEAQDALERLGGRCPHPKPVNTCHQSEKCRHCYDCESCDV